MPDAPFITGSDIVSNAGNAALGYSSGIAYNANPAVENPYATTQSAVARLAQEEEYNRQRAHTEQVKNQQDLAEYLAGTGHSVFNMQDGNGKDQSFNMLPQDREEINQKADELRRKVVQNPTTWKFDPEIRKQASEFEQLKRQAGIRSVDVAQKQQLAAQTNDLKERQLILDNIDKEVKNVSVSTFHNPEPFMPSLTWSMYKNGIGEDVFSGKNKDAWDNISAGTETDAAGNQVQVTYPGIRASVLSQVKDRIIPGSPEYTNATNQVRAFYSSPALMSAPSILSANANIAKYNADRKLKPTDPEYAQPIAEVLPNGQVVPQPLNPQNIGNIAYSLLAEHAGQLGREAKPTKTALELKEKAAEVDAKVATTAKTRKEISQMDDELQMKKDKLAIEKDNMSAADYQAQLRELGAQEKVNTVLKVFNSLHDDPKFKDLKTIDQSNPDEYKDLKEYGNFDAAGWKQVRIPFTQDMKDIGGEPNISPTATGSKNINGSRLPEEQLYLRSPDGNIHNDKIAFKYEEGSGKKKTTRWKVVDAPQAVQNLVSASENYKGDKNFEQDIARKKYNETISSVTSQKTPSDFVPKINGAEVQVRQENGGAPEALIGGVWKKVISKNSKTGEIKVE